MGGVVFTIEKRDWLIRLRMRRMRKFRSEELQICIEEKTILELE